jgi:hypothetical protein
VRRLILEASGDHVIPLCGNPSCINRTHLVRGAPEECRALGRHGSIDLGALWVAIDLICQLRPQTMTSLGT